jgi:hypothetical protein
MNLSGKKTRIGRTSGERYFDIATKGESLKCERTSILGVTFRYKDRESQTKWDLSVFFHAQKSLHNLKEESK